MTYCTEAEARAAGAVGTQDQVAAAIEEAQLRVDQFTGDLFEPTETTVVATLGPDGRALLPYRVTGGTFTTVEDADTGTEYGAGTYRVFSSGTPGDVDGVGLGQAWVGGNILVAGFEPWASTTLRTRRVRVTGEFGWPEVPPGVRAATARLAAWITQSIRPDDDDNPATPPPETTHTADPEGNVIPVVPPFGDDDDQGTPDPATTRTTGLREADSLLVPYRRFRIFTGV